MRVTRHKEVDLSLGAIGHGGNLRETLDLAARHGFESFDPPAGELAALPAADLERLLAEMKAKGLVRLEAELTERALAADFAGA